MSVPQHRDESTRAERATMSEGQPDDVRPTVSVVIPTLGRPELRRALASVQAQTVPPDEVLLLDDSYAGEARIDEPGVVVVRTGGRRGAAGARNLGLERARGDLIAFLDDDDEWYPDHLERALATLRDHPDVDIYASRALVLHSEGPARVEPTVVHDGRGSLLAHYYGRTTWAGRRRRVMTPTLVFRRPVAAIRMDETLKFREDLWWLLSAERAGHRLLQTDHVGVVVHRDDGREAERWTVTTEVEWADRLDTLNPVAGASFLVGTVCRTLARAGQQEALDDVVQRVRARGRLPLDLAVVLDLLRLYARMRRVLRRDRP